MFLVNLKTLQNIISTHGLLDNSRPQGKPLNHSIKGKKRKYNLLGELQRVQKYTKLIWGVVCLSVCPSEAYLLPDRWLENYPKQTTH